MKKIRDLKKYFVKFLLLGMSNNEKYPFSPRPGQGQIQNIKYLSLIKFRGQKGAMAILFSFFVLIIVMLISLTVASVMAFEIKMTREIANSTPAFYAADAGAERCLYQSRCGLLVTPTPECTDAAEIGAGLDQGCATVGSAIALPYVLGNGARVTEAIRSLSNQIVAQGFYSSTNRKVEISW
jgi:hypothetical protein